MDDRRKRESSHPMTNNARIGLLTSHCGGSQTIKDCSLHQGKKLILWLNRNHTNVDFCGPCFFQWNLKFFDCTWRHSGHVGGKNNSEKVFWKFNSIIMENLSYIFLLFWHQHGRLTTWVRGARMAQSVSARPWCKRSWVRFSDLASLFRLLSFPCS